MYVYVKSFHFRIFSDGFRFYKGGALWNVQLSTVDDIITGVGRSGETFWNISINLDKDPALFTLHTWCIISSHVNLQIQKFWKSRLKASSSIVCDLFYFTVIPPHCALFFFFFSSAAITTNFPAEIIKVSSFFFKPQNKQKLPEEDTWLDPVQHRAGFVLHQHNSIPPLLQIHVNEAPRACVCVCVQVCVFTFYIRLVSKHIRASLLPPCLLCLMSTPPPLLSVFVPVIFLSHQSPKQTPTSI